MAAPTGRAVAGAAREWVSLQRGAGAGGGRKDGRTDGRGAPLRLAQDGSSPRPGPGLLARLQATSFSIRTSSATISSAEKVPRSLWKLGRLNHVAIAVPDLEKARSLYKDVLGAQVSETVPLPEHGVYTVFVELGNTKLELLHPLGERSPIAGFLQKNKAGGMHHVCIEVDDITAAVAELKKRKIRILSEEPKIGAHGKPVIFLHPKDFHGVLVELEQA